MYIILQMWKKKIFSAGQGEGYPSPTPLGWVGVKRMIGKGLGRNQRVAVDISVHPIVNL